jgi:hypothetical protein
MCSLQHAKAVKPRANKHKVLGPAQWPGVGSASHWLTVVAADSRMSINRICQVSSHIIDPVFHHRELTGACVLPSCGSGCEASRTSTEVPSGTGREP